MPAKPEWHDRIEGVIESFFARNSDLEWVDTRGLAHLLGIELRTAQNLIKTIPNAQQDRGRSYVVHKEDLILWLQAILAGESIEQERGRRTRFARAFIQWERERVEQGRYAVVEIGTPQQRRETQELQVRDLPGSIHLRPGELRIEFADRFDLMYQLWQVSQAAGNDWEQFRQFEKKPVEVARIAGGNRESQNNSVSCTTLLAEERVYPA